MSIDPTTEPTFARDTSAKPRGNGYTMVPHWLWESDLPNGAKVLLCYLHSHSDSYLARLSMRDCQRAVGSGQIFVWFDALEAVGLVSIQRTKERKRARIRLSMDAWQSSCHLLQNRSRSEVICYEIVAATATKSVQREEQGEEQQKEKNTAAVELRSPADDKPSVAQRANTITRSYHDWYTAKHGTKPLNGFHAMRGIVTKALNAGHDDGNVKRALAAMHDAGVPLSNESLDRQLTRTPKQHTRTSGYDGLGLPDDLVAALKADTSTREQRRNGFRSLTEPETPKELA